MKKCSFVLLLILLCVSRVSAADTTTTYDDINFPQWSKDLRRTEIITFGSLPFVTIWATVGYSAVQYGEFRNPLNKNSDGLSTQDQKHIMQIAAVSCLALGLSDLAITLIKRSVKKRQAMKNRRPDVISIEPLKKAGDSGADMPPPLPDDEEVLPPPAQAASTEYLQGGIERAIF